MQHNPEEEVIKETTQTHVSAMPEIPEETIKDIMFLLPVKSLLKFRSVSPSWLSFIDSPYFVKTHLSKTTPKIIINNAASSHVWDPKAEAKASVLKRCYPHSDNYILGSVNGVMLSHHDNSRPGVLLPFEHRWDVVLQNPYTMTFHKIPFVNHVWPGPKHVLCAAERFIFALWYDDKADDYKVFRNCQFFGCHDGNPFYSQVNIYSWKMKSYRQIDPFPYYMKYDMTDTVFVGGALHWVVSNGHFDKSQWIASFDVSTEGYKLVEQPAYSSGHSMLHLHVLGGCLTVGCTYFRLRRKEYMEVWVMKEYGNAESWCKLLSVRSTDIGDQPVSYLKPLVYSGCGKKVLLSINFKTLLWYDIEKKDVEFVELDMGRVQHFVHLESLVKLSGRDEKRNARDNDEKPQKRTKKRDDFLSKGFKLKL